MSDPLHNPGAAGSHWSTDNVGEAAPGVLTPLSASIWTDVGQRMPRRIAYDTDGSARRPCARAADRLVVAGADSAFAAAGSCRRDRPVRDALQRFDRTITVHSLALLSALQPLRDVITKLVERTGVGDVRCG